MRAVVRALAALVLSSPAAAQPASPPVNFEIATPVLGAWRYVRTASGSEATFSSPAGIAQLTLRCTLAGRRVTILKTASAPASALSVWTSSASRSLPATFDASTARVSADLQMLDPLLDALALSRGRVAFTTPGVAPLVLPACLSWPVSWRIAAPEARSAEV